MTTTTGGWYALACDRARASARRRGSSERSREWPAFASPVALADGPLGAVQAADREIARQTALRARAVAEFAATRRADADRAQGEPGAMSPERWAARPDVVRGVSEWAAQELVIALAISSEAADALLIRSLNLVHRLPGTLAALEAGALHPGHLWSMLDKVAPIEDDVVRAEVEAELLRWGAGRVISPAQLGAKARREVARHDARAAARQLEKAIKERGVHLRPEPTDGMAAVTTLLTVPEALALYRALGAYADASEDDPGLPPRTREQKMTDCLLDLVLRPGESELPPVQVLLTVVASVATMAGGDDPGEIDGHVVPAEMIRQFLRALEPARPAEAPAAIPVTDPASPPVLDAPGPVPTGGPGPAAWDEQYELERWWAEMERRVVAGELAGAPEPLPTDQIGACSDGTEPDRIDDDGPSVDRGTELADGEEPGWWAVADRAVADAGLATREAGRALARARQLVRTASTADTADEVAWQDSPSGRVSAAADAVEALASAADEHRRWLADLLATTAGGGLRERPRIALADALSGALLALTDLPGLLRAGTCGRAACRADSAGCEHDLTDNPGLGPPGPTDGYRPAVRLDRWVRTRDRRCRFPGCRRRVPRGGELDHDRPWPDGDTSAGNLVGYCTSHHRGKHQAPGWQYSLLPDGTLEVTTPSGLTASTVPVPF
ncbi:MAG: DUF222 domain-containing protein [Blastococcus sp.]